MINYYQPFLLPFLGTRPYRMPKEILRTYFLSFEDGLWVLLKNRNVPKGSIILIPDFYCMDVVENIRTHGYTPVFYPLDDHFRITQKKLESYIRKHTPAVLIIFHACGITHLSGAQLTPLFRRHHSTLVIEDSVHRLIHPETVTLIHPNHYVIDSLRKVSPLPGSFLYASAASAPIQPDRSIFEWRYITGVYLKYALFRLLFVLGTILHSDRLVRLAHEHALQSHDNLVGDSRNGYAGGRIVPLIHSFLNFGKVTNLKHDQASLYMDKIKNFVKKHPAWYEIKIPRRAKQDLHVFPLGLRNSQQDVLMRIQSHLHKHHVVSWFKFTDAPWSRKRGVLFLPLGFHITHADIRHTIKTLGSI